MSQSAVRIKHRRRPRRRLVAALSAAGAVGALSPATAGPQLALPEPEGRRSTWVAASLTTLLHAAGIAVLMLLAWMAPPVEQLIEVKIIRELPGADVEPAPARKLIQPRQRRTPVQAARRVTAQAVTQPRVVNLTAQQLKVNELEKALAPQQVQRRRVVSTRTQARGVDHRRVATNVDLTQLQNLQVVPTDLEAPVVDHDGPREIDPGAALEAPDDFAELPDVENVDYRSAAPVAVISDPGLSKSTAAFEFDTGVGIYAVGEGAEGTGGTGTATGVVPCLQSAHVQRYYLVIQERAYQHWNVPDGVPDDTAVRLRFALDSSGAATHVEFIGDSDPALGNSAIAALRAASPFPRMNDAVRCLAGKKLTGTFTVAPK